MNLDKKISRTGPLGGIRVLDIATIIAAPLSATLLADYGADVVKVELPGSGDGARDFPPFKEGKSLWWKAINRNKRLITLDLRSPEGQEILKRLLPEFDVLVENFRPGTLDGWGLSRDVLWEINPSLIILRTTGFGQNGPYRNRPGFARVFEAMGGLTYITGQADGEPMHTGYPIGDSVGGLFGTIGILTALVRRLQDPQQRGEEIDLSMTEGVFRLLDFLPIEYDQLGSVRSRSGNASQYAAPSAVYRTADEHYVSLSGSTNALFAANARAIKYPELIHDPRFSSNSSRLANAKELNTIFSTWIKSHTLEDVLTAFETAGGTIAPIYSIEQIEDDPQMRARRAIVEVPDADFGQVRLQATVPRFSNAACPVINTGGSIGQDNEAIYKDQLGLTEGELLELRKRNVI